MPLTFGVPRPADEFKVLNIKTLGKNGDGKARELLQRIAHQVQPIMHKRKWSCPLLSEFLPKNPSLRGINFGGGGGKTTEIKLRIRRVGQENDFYDYEDLLLVMLHELSHNIRGPHDAVFYKLLDEITAECEELMAKGIGGTGEGFDAAPAGRSGAKGFGGHNPDIGKLRHVILKAAEERAKKAAVMPTGSRKLGGSSFFRIFSAREAAGQAAIRREEDNVWCPCETKEKELHTPKPNIPDAEPADVVILPEDGALREITRQKSDLAAPQQETRPPASEAAPSAPVVCDLTCISDSEDEAAPPPSDPPLPAPHQKRRLESIFSRFKGMESGPGADASPNPPKRQHMGAGRPASPLPSGCESAGADLLGADLFPIPPLCTELLPTESDLGDDMDIDITGDTSPGPVHQCTPRGASADSFPGNGAADLPLLLPHAGGVGARGGAAAAGGGQIDKGKRPMWWQPALAGNLGHDDSDGDDVVFSTVLQPGSGKGQASRWYTPPGWAPSVFEVGSTSGRTSFECHLDSTWVCQVCTLQNQRGTSICAACETACPICAKEAAREEAARKASSQTPSAGNMKQSSLSRLFHRSGPSLPGDIILGGRSGPPSAERSINPFHINSTPDRSSTPVPYRPPGTAKSHGERLLQATMANRAGPPVPSQPTNENSMVRAHTPRPSPINSGSFYGSRAENSSENERGAPSDLYGVGRSDAMRTYSRKQQGDTGGGGARAPMITRVGTDLGLGVRKNWACRQCTLENSQAVSTCTVCGAWRFSTGAPAMSRPTIGGM